jgi:uncharacterized protein (TIGR03118 family)
MLVVGAVGVAVAAALVGQSGAAQAASAAKSSFRQVNLVSDLPGRAQLRDPDVKNPWGIAFGSATPLWVSNNFTPSAANPKSPADLLTEVTVYTGANGKQKITKLPLEVTASAPTGIVFNPTSAFQITQRGTKAPARFLFNENTADLATMPPSPVAEITGWQPAMPLPTTTRVVARTPGTFYTGLAVVMTDDGPRLLAGSNASGGIDVFDGRFHKLAMPGAFVDKNLNGLAPYNVTALGGRVYVSYAKEGAMTGAISVFTPEGRFIKRLVTGGPLVDPWGMALAPEHWGRFGGDLLVGNVDNGMINAFDPQSGKFEGTLKDSHGKPLVNEGLWGIAFGNGVIGTPRTLIFAAGIGTAPGQHVYEHGLVGLIMPTSAE